MVYFESRDGQSAARRPHVARHSVFSGPRKQLGKTLNLKIPLTYRKCCAGVNLNRELLLFPLKGVAPAKRGLRKVAPMLN